MRLFTCGLLLFVGVGVALADDVPLNNPFSFRLEESTLRPPAIPWLGTPSANGAAPAPPKTPEREKAPPNSTPREFNGQTYYFILI